MLNKNDPLIGAVQEVMKRNQTEREATRLVNEAFGIEDRKALPHEYQAEWDSVYQQVLAEGLHPNQQKLDVHEPEKDKLTKHDFKMLRAKKKPMEEGNDPMDGDTTSPSSMGIKKPDYATGTPDYAKPKTQTVNRAAKTSLPPGTMKEAKVNPYAVGMAAVKKSTGDEPPMEKKNITKAHEIAKKIIAKKKMNEGFNNRHSLSVNASVEEQVVAEQARARSDYGLGAIPAQKNAAKRRAELDARMEKGIDTVAPFIPGVGAARSIDKYARGQQGLGQTAVDVGLNLAGGPLIKGAQKGISYLRNLRKAAPVSQTTANLTAGAARRPPGQSVPQITSTPGSATGRFSASGPFGSIRDVSKVTRRGGDARAAAGKDTRGAPSGTMMARLRQQGQQVQQGRAGGSTVGATQAAARTRLAQQTQQGRVGTNTTGATQAAARIANRPTTPNAAGANASRLAKIQGNKSSTIDQDLAKGLNNQPPAAAAATRTGPSFEKTGRGNAPSAQTTTTQPDYDKMTFGQAFKSAREAAKKQGDASMGKFKYKGKEYQTNIKGTGTAKKPQEKYQLASKLKDVTPVSATKTPTPTQTVAKPTARPTDVGSAGPASPTMATNAKAAGQMAVDRMKAQNLAKSQTSSMFGGSVNKPKPFDQFQDKGRYAGDMRATKGSAAAERLANPTFVPTPSPGSTYRRNSTLAAPSAMAATSSLTRGVGPDGQGGLTVGQGKPAITGTSSLTRRVGPDGQGGLTVGQNKPAMGMSFTPKTTIDAAKKSVSSVTPQMSQSVGSLQQKASMAGKERGLAPDFAKRELTRRQNIQTVKGA